MGKLMTVEEFAEYFRTTTTTVYRWLKEGKIKGFKIGKEWRLDEDAISALMEESSQESVPSSCGEHAVWSELNLNEHLMVVAASRAKIFELEASFFTYALACGKHLMKGCWWQDPDELRDEYEKYGLDIEDLERDGIFKVIDFNRLFNKYGISGPVEAWRSEIMRNRRYELWASGSPGLDSCNRNPDELIYFEKRLNDTIKDLPIIGICPYSIGEFGETCFSAFNQIMRHHSGVVFYDGDQSVVLHQA
jgi:excisionase family DNA binding protein